MLCASCFVYAIILDGLQCHKFIYSNITTNMWVIYYAMAFWLLWHQQIIGSFQLNYNRIEHSIIIVWNRYHTWAPLLTKALFCSTGMLHSNRHDQTATKRVPRVNVGNRTSQCQKSNFSMKSCVKVWVSKTDLWC